MAETNHVRHIDGLRAIAVLPVIFYHAGFEIFRGGFVGVDVFFVISGYLITNIIYKQMLSGEFSLVNFYYRRVKRIFPVLYFIMLVSLPLAWILLSPFDLIDFAKSLIGVSLFSSNILFWRQSGYFTTAAEFIPFLHTWSLSVEEQFYLIFPLFCYILFNSKRRLLLPAILIFWTISLVGSLTLSYWKPSAAFFLSPLRAWELLTGSVIALFYRNLSDSLQRPFLRSAMAMFGLSLICGALFFIDRWTVFPGLAVLFPIFGAAFIILYADENNLTGRLLSSSLFVNIGVISFSAYLWHNLLFAFARVHGFAYSNSYAFFYLSLISLVLSYFTYRFIEQPFRYRLYIAPRLAFGFALLASVFFILIGSIFLIFDGFPGRFSNAERDLLKFRAYNSRPIYQTGSCFLEFGDSNNSFNDACRPAEIDRRSVVIWGDSHAAALSFGLRNNFKNFGQFARSACPPVFGGALNLNRICANFNDMVMREILLIKPEKIFLHANWQLYDNNTIHDSVYDTISYLNLKLPRSQIIIIGLVPQYPNTLPDYMVKNRVQLSAGARLSTPFLDDMVKFDNLFLNAKNLKYSFISPLNIFCYSGKCLVTSQYEQKVMPMAWDYGHLTAAGSNFLAENIIISKEFSDSHVKE